MTVLSSLRSRILLSRLAVQLPLAEASDRLPGLVIGGVDLAMLTTAHSLDRRADLKVLRELRNYVGQRVLLAVDTPDIESDVRVLLPGDRDLSRPHQWRCWDMWFRTWMKSPGRTRLFSSWLCQEPAQMPS